MSLQRSILALRLHRQPVGYDTIDLHEDYVLYYGETIQPIRPSTIKRVLAEHTNASVIMDGMKKLRTAKFGVPEIVSATDCPNATITAQCMEECTTISLDDNDNSCTQQGSLGTGLELLKQFQEQLLQEPCGFCKIELTEEGVEAWMNPDTGSMLQGGETVKTLSGVKVKVTDEAGLRELLGNEYDDIVTDGYVNQSEVCFVGGDKIEGNPLRGTADGCQVTGYGYGILHARLWKHPEILLSDFKVLLGIGCIDEDGKYNGEECSFGNFINEWPAVVNSFLDTGKNNWVVFNGSQYLSVDKINLSSTDIISAHYKFSEIAENSCIYCSRGNSTTTYSFTQFFVKNDNKLRFDMGSTWNLTAIPSVNTTYHTTHTSGQASVNGQQYSINSVAFNTNYPFMIGASYVGNLTTIQNYLKGSISSIKITSKNGTTKHWFIPFVRNGVVGFFDVVNDVFYGSTILSIDTNK